ncbi:hypothetical protein E2C01_043365 [Portunus trituberculatus]|uniref:Uncharacterized protein n=1 Tax=Portunus trituberculatus TaxID=210409 RepID=A0A5B7FVY4_PORTR|nr:hypothetical protein [Portunus trituberculatus]
MAWCSVQHYKIGKMAWRGLQHCKVGRMAWCGVQHCKIGKMAWRGVQHCKVGRMAWRGIHHCKSYKRGEGRCPPGTFIYRVRCQHVADMLPTRPETSLTGYFSLNGYMFTINTTLQTDYKTVVHSLRDNRTDGHRLSARLSELVGRRSSLQSS